MVRRCLEVQASEIRERPKTSPAVSAGARNKRDKKTSSPRELTAARQVPAMVGRVGRYDAMAWEFFGSGPNSSNRPLSTWTVRCCMVTNAIAAQSACLA